MGEAYRTADLGPLSPCTTGSLPTSVFPRGFDTASGADLDLNNSATPAGTAAIDLTPSASYSCRSQSRRALVGNGAKKLTVRGTVFIDGSATITSAPSDRATNVGQGTLVLTGTFMMKNALMCVKMDSTTSGNNSHCDTATGAWDPNVGALVIIADGDGGYDATQKQWNDVDRRPGHQHQGLRLPGRAHRQQGHRRRHDLADAGPDAQRLPHGRRRAVERPDLPADPLRSFGREHSRPSTSPQAPSTTTLRRRIAP